MLGLASEVRASWFAPASQRIGPSHLGAQRQESAEHSPKWGFTAERRRSKDDIDEKKRFICGGGRSDITPEWDHIQICIITCSMKALANAIWVGLVAMALFTFACTPSERPVSTRTPNLTTNQFYQSGLLAGRKHLKEKPATSSMDTPYGYWTNWSEASKDLCRSGYVAGLSGR